MQIEIVSSRLKIAFMLLGSLVFVAVEFLLPGPLNSRRFEGVVLFSVCAAVAIAMLLRPQRLRLDQEGITVLGGLLWSPTKIAWCDVSGFRVVLIRPGVSMIGYNYNSEVANKPRGPAFSRLIAGVDGSISGVWPGSKAALVDQLNACRERAMRGEAV